MFSWSSPPSFSHPAVISLPLHTISGNIYRRQIISIVLARTIHSCCMSPNLYFTSSCCYFSPYRSSPHKGYIKDLGQTKILLYFYMNLEDLSHTCQLKIAWLPLNIRLEYIEWFQNIIKFYINLSCFLEKMSFFEQKCTFLAEKNRCD